jgi:hypothetical protein
MLTLVSSTKSEAVPTNLGHDDELISRELELLDRVS